MTFLSALFYIYMIGSLVFCILNIISGMVTKKTFRMLLNFIWILLLGATGVVTWLYYQGFVASHYFGWFPEMQHITFGMKDGNKLAQAVLYANIAVLAFFILYVIILIARLVRGVNRAVDKTAETINKGVDDIKSKFSKKEKETVEEAETAEEPVVATPVAEPVAAEEDTTTDA